MSLYSRDDSGFGTAFLIAAAIVLFILVINYLDSQTKLANKTISEKTNVNVVFVTNYVDAPTNK